MQAVQLQQILPQMQLARQAKEVSAHADDSRFMDALKVQKSLQTQESERQEETGKTVSYQKNALSRSEESNKTSENQTDEKVLKTLLPHTFCHVYLKFWPPNIGKNSGLTPLRDFLFGVR